MNTHEGTIGGVGAFVNAAFHYTPGGVLYSVDLLFCVGMGK